MKIEKSNFNDYNSFHYDMHYQQFSICNTVYIIQIQKKIKYIYQTNE